MNSSVSAICPIKNEEENIMNMFNYFKPLGNETEILFVEGGSTDNSWKVAKSIDRRTNQYGVTARAIRQVGKGKAEAVVTGFNNARGHYLIIVDADFTIRHKDLEKILSLFTKYGDNIIASGNRLKGISKPKAFYWINYIGNYFFRYYYSFLFKHWVLDIACGTKAMTKDTWSRVKDARLKGGKLDKWGDIDWLYYGLKSGASLRFVNVNYYEREFGESKLQNVSTRVKFAFDMVFIGIKIFKN